MNRCTQPSHRQPWPSQPQGHYANNNAAYYPALRCDYGSGQTSRYCSYDKPRNWRPKRRNNAVAPGKKILAGDGGNPFKKCRKIQNLAAPCLRMSCGVHAKSSPNSGEPLADSVIDRSSNDFILAIVLKHCFAISCSAVRSMKTALNRLVM